MSVDRPKTESFPWSIAIDHDSLEPIHIQVAHALRSAILNGILPDQSLLPSMTELSQALKVSRSTIARSFETLASQGYVRTAKTGTYVQHKFAGHLDYCELSRVDGQELDLSPVGLSSYARWLIELSNQAQSFGAAAPAANSGGPAIELTPLNQWKLLLEQNCRMKDLSRLEYSHEPFGYPPLREAYAAYLGRARAVRCSSEQVVVFSARELRLDLICRLLVDEGDCVAVEEPGYGEVRERFLSFGARVVAIPTDHNGLDVNYLCALDAKFKLVYVSPSYVDPTGATMSLSRRQKLIEWASEKGTFIIEDDYASEYRYRGRPLPSLQGLDNADVVIHLSCLWKVLFPVVRLGFLIVPKRLTEAFRLAKTMTENDLPLFDQFALTDFINEGMLERHIRKTRAIYGQRREALVSALIEHFADRVTISPEAAGFELLINIKGGIPDEQLLELAAKDDIPLFSSRQNYMNTQKCGEFIMPFGDFDEDTLARHVRKLKALVG
jgi:GntR family transcriptional regulator/MocR family aminotransferase